MEIFTVQVGALTIVALVLALVGIWSARSGEARLAMLGVFTALIGLIFTSSAGLLGRPKPVSLEWLQPQAQEATILSGHIVENQGIYLTLLVNEGEPKLYVLPWDRKLAEQLQQAQSEAAQNGTGVMMRMPFEKASKSDDNAPFYAAPQEALPEKAPPEAGIKLS